MPFLVPLKVPPLKLGKNHIWNTFWSLKSGILAILHILQILAMFLSQNIPKGSNHPIGLHLQKEEEEKCHIIKENVGILLCFFLSPLAQYPTLHIGDWIVYSAHYICQHQPLEIMRQ